MAMESFLHDRVVTAAAEGPGNPVMVVGARTGREGIAGASFASAELEGERRSRCCPRAIRTRGSA